MIEFPCLDCPGVFPGMRGRKHLPSRAWGPANARGDQLEGVRQKQSKSGGRSCTGSVGWHQRPPCSLEALCPPTHRRFMGDGQAPSALRGQVAGGPGTWSDSHSSTRGSQRARLGLPRALGSSLPSGRRAQLQLEKGKVLEVCWALDGQRGACGGQHGVLRLKICQEGTSAECSDHTHRAKGCPGELGRQRIRLVPRSW